jgi:hypothetical protein
MSRIALVGLLLLFVVGTKSRASSLPDNCRLSGTAVICYDEAQHQWVNGIPESDEATDNPPASVDSSDRRVKIQGSDVTEENSGHNPADDNPYVRDAK